MMRASRRRIAPALACIVAVALGCASLQAARLYDEGTKQLDAHDWQGAIASFERAAALQPGASEIQNHLGLAYLGAGRTDDAHAAFARAVDLDCDNEAARTNLLALESGPAFSSSSSVSPRERHVAREGAGEGER